MSVYRRSRLRRLARGLALYLAATAVLAVIGLVIQAGLTSGSGTPQAIPPTVLPTSGWVDQPAPQPSATAPAATPSPALTGPVRVVQGSQVINGVALGFPHSTAGAVSAADAVMTEVGSTLDPDRAAAVMRLVADPAYSDGPQLAAAGAASDRESLGLPASGPVPAGDSLDVTPAEYQVRDVTADQVTVLLLTDVIATTPGQGTVSRAGTFAVALHWAAGDWKLLPNPATDYSGLIAEPGSPQAAALGWQLIEP